MVAIEDLVWFFKHRDAVLNKRFYNRDKPGCRKEGTYYSRNRDKCLDYALRMRMRSQ